MEVRRLCHSPGSRRFSIGLDCLARAGEKAMIATICLLAAMPAGFSQEPAEVAPREPDEMPPGDVVIEDEPDQTEAENGEDVLIERVRTLIFYGDPQDEIPPVEDIGDGILFRGLEVPGEAAFRFSMQRYLEKPLTEGSLQKITREIVAHYRANDLPVVDAIVPEQDITDGVLKILILEGRITAVRTEGNRHFPNAILRRAIRLSPGERIAGEPLRQDIEWLNRNPFRQVNAVFTPGEAPGDTELILLTDDRPPVRLFTGYENTGHRLTRRSRYYAGLNWANAFNQDHQFNYQFTFSGDLESFRAHSGSYIVPLPWRHIATVFGSYIDTSARVLDPFELTGNSWHTGARYAVPLPRPPRTTFNHEARIGGDYKSANTNLAFGGDEIFDVTAEVIQGMAGYEATWNDRAGRNFFGVDLFYSPGGVTGHNSDEVFAESRPGTSAEYVYGQVRGERLTDLPMEFSWQLEGVFQATSDRLIFTEQLALGGHRTIRGYLEREVTADEGYFIRNEIRSFEWRALGATHRMGAVGFFDIGEARVRDARDNERGARTLAGAGAGIRYRIDRYFSARLDLAFPLRSGPTTRRGDPRIHAGVTASW